MVDLGTEAHKRGKKPTCRQNRDQGQRPGHILLRQRQSFYISDYIEMYPKIQ